MNKKFEKSSIDTLLQDNNLQILFPATIIV